MDYKLPENILEFMRFQKKIFHKYHTYIKSLMINNYKKAAIFAYWLNDYLDYIKAENSFNPSMNITYKRGQVVFVNFGFRIGTELGGDHYAIVLDVKNSRQSKSITVLPLKSNKNKITAYSKIYYFHLGNHIKTLLKTKAQTIINGNFEEAMCLAEEIRISKTNNPESDIQNSPEIKKAFERLKRNRRIADNIIDYADKLNGESVADLGQIITISKLRIKHPCKKHDVLTGVILDESILKDIDSQIKKLYVGL